MIGMFMQAIEDLVHIGTVAVAEKAVTMRNTFETAFAIHLLAVAAAFRMLHALTA